MVKSKIIECRVKKITISKNCDVYDITTSKNHNFFANGILVHNCGEQPLQGFSACNLSSINLNKFVNGTNFDWKGFYEVCYNVTILMDNLIDVMDFPDERFEINVRRYRQVGVGPMGLADALFNMGIRYDSQQGRAFADKMMETMLTACIDCSSDMALTKGKFYNYDKYKDRVESIISRQISSKEVLNKVREQGLRNVALNTAAPTGTTALSCDASYGIEPCFGLVFQKNLISGQKMLVANPIFQEKFSNEEWYTDDLLDRIFKNGGTLKNLRGIPEEVRKVFVTAHDIKPKDRIEMQSVLQAHCQSAISSCITPDSLIDTDGGLFYMDEITDFTGIEEGNFCSNKNFEYKVLNHMDERVPIDSFYNNGTKAIFKVNLRNGLSIKCTGNEKLLLLNEDGDLEWKDVSLLFEGDRVKVKCR